MRLIRIYIFYHQKRSISKKITFENEKGEVEEVELEEASSEQLSEHMKSMYHEIMASNKLAGADKIFEEINFFYLCLHLLQ